MTVLSFPAPAKLNLYLHVTGKREDGYHLLDSLAAFPQGVEDTITIEASDRFEFIAQGPYAEGLAGPGNLVVKAAEALAMVTGRSLQCRITLDKHIPPGAGLGGGSSDAAAVVRGLLSFWKMEVPEDVLGPLLTKLGADVPVCYFGEACRFRGIGDRIETAPSWPPLWITLIWPGISSFTKDVFAAFQKPFTAERTSLPARFDTRQDFLAFLKTTDNDLTEAASSLSPAIQDAFEALRANNAPSLVRMSGSGSCVFGLFEDEGACETATNKIAADHPSWWVRAGRI